MLTYADVQPKKGPGAIKNVYELLANPPTGAHTHTSYTAYTSTSAYAYSDESPKKTGLHTSQVNGLTRII